MVTARPLSPAASSACSSGAEIPKQKSKQNRLPPVPAAVAAGIDAQKIRIQKFAEIPLRRNSKKEDSNKQTKNQRPVPAAVAQKLKIQNVAEVPGVL